MHLRLIAAAALAAMPLAPAVSWAQEGSIEIQTQATVTITPDRASRPITMMVSAETEAKARAALDAKEREIRQELGALGYKPEQVLRDTGPGSEEMEQRVDWDACRGGTRSDVAYPVARAAPDRAIEMPVATATAVLPAAKPCDKKAYFGSRRLVVTLYDPENTSQNTSLASLTQGGKVDLGKPTFGLSDPAAARRKAHEQAMAQARAEAELLAGQMGYRIVGIKRVSTAAAPMSIDSLIKLLTEIDGPGRKRGPEWFAASVSQTVTIDFIAVPK